MCQNTLYRASPAYARYTENYAEQGQGYAGVPRGQKNAKPQAGPRAGTHRMFCLFCELLITTGRSSTGLSRCSMSNCQLNSSISPGRVPPLHSSSLPGQSPDSQSSWLPPCYWHSCVAYFRLSRFYPTIE